MGWAWKRKRLPVALVCADRVRRHSAFKKSICTRNIPLEAPDVLKFSLLELVLIYRGS